MFGSENGHVVCQPYSDSLLIEKRALTFPWTLHVVLGGHGEVVTERKGPEKNRSGDKHLTSASFNGPKALVLVHLLVQVLVQVLVP